MGRTALALVLAALVARGSLAQSSVVEPIDPLRFSQLKDFVAGRSSSNNPDPDSNDDSKRPIPGETVTLADLSGPGIVTHIWLTIAANEHGWFGEGDDHFFVDGEKKAAIEGTGSEDYFSDAWGLHVEDGPYAGVPVAQGTGLGSRMTGYRWHLADPIPFTRSLYFEIEHKGWTFKPDGSVKSTFGERVDLMSSVAYWYQQGIARGLPPIPYGSARFSQGNAKQIEVENALPQVKAERGKASVSRDLFWSLNDLDPVTRGLAALELRNKGRAAKPALGALIAKLEDPTSSCA